MGGGGARGRSESRRRDEWAHGAAGPSSHRGTGGGRSRGVEEVKAIEGRDVRHEETAGRGEAAGHNRPVARSHLELEIV